MTQAALKCGACGSVARPSAKFCDSCGLSIDASAVVPVALRAMVLIPETKVVWCADSVPAHCPTCKRPSTLGKAQQYIEKIRLQNKRSAEHRGDAWMTRQYDLHRCSSCGNQLLVMADREDVLRHEHRADSPERWDDKLPLVRAYRGTCGLCNKAEMSHQCRHCNRMVCTSHWSYRHSLCNECSPKCAICGAISKRACNDCKRQICETHGKGWFPWTWLCLDCKSRRAATK
jgi:hypothetical protein